MRLHSSWIVLALVGAAGSPARADAPAAADAAAAPAAEAAPAAGADALTLPKGRLLVDAFVEISLSKGAVFKPFSISPDLWYGVSDKLTVGLVHSGLGETGFVGSALGNSLCLSGSSGGCAKFYNNVGLDARYALTHGKLSWAFDGGFDFRALSPFQLALKLGAVGRWKSGKLALELEPELFFGLTKRAGTTDPMTMMTTGANKDSFAVPVSVFYALSPKLDVAGQTGLVLPLEGTSSGYAIPLTIGAHYRISTPLAVMLAFSFPTLIAGGGAGGVSARALLLGGSYAF